MGTKDSMWKGLSILKATSQLYNFAYLNRSQVGTYSLKYYKCEQDSNPKSEEQGDSILHERDDMLQKLINTGYL